MLSPRHRAVLWLTTAAVLASCLLTGCHDDTPPSDTAAAAPLLAALPVVPVKASMPVPVKKAKKPAAAKNYLRTDAAGIVITN